MVSGQDRRIGIIGASGAVGRVVTDVLAQTEGVTLVLGGRRPPSDMQAAAGKTARARIEAIAVDVLDAKALHRFVDGLSVVVNCAGPSYVIGDRIARAALAAGADYVDPGGYDRLARALQSLDRDVTERGLRFVFNAGLLPGISGVLPAFLASSCLDRVERLECVYVGTDKWSLASALDIIDSLGDFGVRRHAGYISDGVHVPMPFRKSLRSLDPGAGLARTTVALFHAEEIARLAAREAIPTVLVWGGNHGRRSGVVLALAKCLALHRWRWSRHLAARSLAWASTADARRQPAAFVILCDLEGLRNGKPVRVTGSMRFGDTYLATGRIAGLATGMLLAPDRVRPGVAMLHEAVEPAALLTALDGYGYERNASTGDVFGEDEHAIA